jgi:hypothetical protein
VRGYLLISAPPVGALLSGWQMEKLEKEFTDLVALNRWNELVEWDRYYRGDFDRASLPSTNHSAVAKEYDDY